MTGIAILAALSALACLVAIGVHLRYDVLIKRDNALAAHHREVAKIHRHYAAQFRALAQLHRDDT